MALRSGDKEKIRVQEGKSLTCRYLRQRSAFDSQRQWPYVFNPSFSLLFSARMHGDYDVVLDDFYSGPRGQLCLVMMDHLLHYQLVRLGQSQRIISITKEWRLLTLTRDQCYVKSWTCIHLHRCGRYRQGECQSTDLFDPKLFSPEGSWNNQRLASEELTQ